jgi:hypothetical protein
MAVILLIAISMFPVARAPLVDEHGALSRETAVTTQVSISSTLGGWHPAAYRGEVVYGV